MRYINRLLSSDDAGRIAHNASLLHLALITGFAENGLLQEAWAPRMVINIIDQHYEVRSSSRVSAYPTSDRSWRRRGFKYKYLASKTARGFTLPAQRARTISQIK